MTQSNKPQIIKGDTHTDERGTLVYNNSFDTTPVKRYYCIQPTQFRAWQGHKKEQKWFSSVKGNIKILLVKPDNWEHPSFNLKVEEFTLKENTGDILHVPAGYAIGIKPLTPGASLGAFSDFTLIESQNDSYRFDKDLWYYETFM